MNTILILSAAIIMFAVFIFAFKTGLRLGMETSKGKIPDKPKDPIAAVKEYKAQVEQSKEDKANEIAMRNFFSYDGNPQKEIKHE